MDDEGTTFCFYSAGYLVKYMLRYRSEIMMILQEILGIKEYEPTKKRAVVFAGTIAIERANSTSTAKATLAKHSLGMDIAVMATGNGHTVADGIRLDN